MATNLKLTSIAEAKNQASTVLGYVEDIRTILNTLNDEVNSNVNSSSVWTGDSANRFKEAWNNCADNFEAFVNHLHTINEKIDYTATEVQKFDQAV